MLRLLRSEDAQRDPAAVDAEGVGLDELCRLAAREMIAVALEAERRTWLDAHAELVDAAGKRLVVGNGYLPDRTIVTGAGAVEVKAPRVADKRPAEEREPYSSALLPPYMRKSPKVTEVLPLLYLRGLSTGGFAPALAGFFGTGAGLSASTVNRLTEAWQAEHADWSRRELSGVDYVYIWADGVYVNVRLPDADGAQDRLCLLVIVGVRPDGRKDLVAVADGHREDTESWLDLLRELKAREMVAPELAVADGALGFWAALAQVFPPTREQACSPQDPKSILLPIGCMARPRSCSRRSTPPTAERPRSRRPRGSRSSSARIPRRPSRSPRTSTGCWRSSTSQPSTGSTCGPPMRSRRRSRPCGCASAPPRPRQPRRRRGDGLQAARRRPGPVASDQRPRTRRVGPRRRDIHRRQAARTPRRHAQSGPGTDRDGACRLNFSTDLKHNS